MNITSQTQLIVMVIIVITIILAVTLIPILVSANLFYNVLRDKYDHRKEIEDKEQLFNVSVQESRELLEYLVKNAMYEWIVYNINPSTENYMAKNEQEDCIKYIIQKIMENLTPTIAAQLAIGYPFDTEEEKIKTIMNRAKLVVLDYSIKQNTQTNNSNNIPNINLL